MLRPGARFSKAPEIFRARKAIFSSAVFKDGEVTPETFCMKGAFVQSKNMRMKHLCNHKIRDYHDYAMTLCTSQSQNHPSPPGQSPGI